MLHFSGATEQQEPSSALPEVFGTWVLMLPCWGKAGVCSPFIWKQGNEKWEQREIQHH